MRLRRVEERDRQKYLEMASAFYHSSAVLHPIPEEYLEKTFDEMIRSDVYADGFLLEEEDAIVGYALTSKSFSQECGGQCVWIEEISILPAHQGRGYGSQAFALLEAYYPSSKRFRLEVEPENLGAIRLYQRLGYQVFEYAQYVKDRC